MTTSSDHEVLKYKHHEKKEKTEFSPFFVPNIFNSYFT